MIKTALVTALSLLVLAPSAWARPSTAEKTWRAAKAAALHPRDAARTIRSAEQVLGRKVTLGEQVSILAAHHHGMGRLDARGTLHWKPAEIVGKARLLGAFTPAERRALFEAKVVGQGGWVMVVQRQDYIYNRPYRYNGVLYPSVDAAHSAMEREKGAPVRIEVNEDGYVVRP